MKKILFIFISILSLNGLGQILVDNPSQDLGDVYEDKGEVTAKFILKNPYKNDTIRIYDITTSCGCTVILSEDTLIMPESSIELKLSYNPKGRAGLFQKSIEVVSRVGIYEQHRLYLKITGNVVAQNMAVRDVNPELIEYLVAPINFYSITPYDTSYLDFNFFISFVNDISYEIDFYQFTTLGFEIGIDNYDHIEQLEYLMNFTKAKIVREFSLRGYQRNNIFFQDPVFVQEKLPEWASASIKVYSVNFGDDYTTNSVIKTSRDEFVENENLMLNLKKNARPSIEDVVAAVNFEGLEGKLFLNNSLNLQGVILSPKRMTYHDREKMASSLEKVIFKKLKKSSGITKKNVQVHFDSLGYHPGNKYLFQLWDKSDEEKQQAFSYELKNDIITPPLLPTYKQSTLLSTSIDETNPDFKYFWKNLLLNQKAGKDISLLIESSKSTIPRAGTDDMLILARNDGNKAKDFLIKKFKSETGRELQITVKPFIHGPEYDPENKYHTDYRQYEYINIIPIVHAEGMENEYSPNPYLANFDYFFIGVDTSSWVFSKFANYIAEEVEQFGYVNLILESSISQIPIEKRKANIFLAYERALESQHRLQTFLEKKLIDPNRIIFTEERFLVQGPKYDGKIPIIKYRKFQYIKIIPEKFLTQ
jgi:hypothetical protein